MGARRSGFAGVLVLALVLAACGHRVPERDFEAGGRVTSRTVVDQGLPGDTPDAGVDPGAPAGPDGGAEGETDTGNPGGGPDAPADAPAPGGPSAAPQGPSPAPRTGGPGGTQPPGGESTKKPYASDVGVTASSVKVGNITTIGGPMPGQFEPWLLGLRTWVNEVNEKGGINGRKFNLLPCDDAMDSEKNKACARDLIENQKVFAIVGTDTPAMPSAKYVNDQKVPAVGVAPIGNYTAIYPYWFSAYGERGCPRNGVDDPDDPRYCRGGLKPGSNAIYKYFKDSIGVTKGAVFWHNIDISKQAGLDFKHVIEASGIKVVYTAETQVAEPDYTGHVLQMKDRGVEGVWDAMEINNNIRLMQAMDRQNWKPKAKISTISVWGQEVKSQVTGPSRDSLFIAGSTRPYTDTGNPAVGSFIKLFKRYFPNKKQHQWNVDGYMGAWQFGDAVTALGADLTRQGLVDWLNGLKAYGNHGLGCAVDYQMWPDSYYQTPKPPQSCFSVVQFKDGDFQNSGGGDSLKSYQGEWVQPRSR